jgi:16S rRNA processing protein RimM
VTVADWEKMAVVGRIGRPHGLRGQVVVHPETDFVEARFRPGAVLWTQPAAGGEERLAIASARLQNRKVVVGFEGLSSIEAAGRLTGQELRIPEDALQPLAPGRYYEYQLVGCVVEAASAGTLGAVVRVEGGAGGSRLVVDGERGEVQVPLAADICVEVDVEAKRIRIEPPDGLLELNETKRSRRGPRPQPDR